MIISHIHFNGNINNLKIIRGKRINRYHHSSPISDHSKRNYYLTILYQAYKVNYSNCIIVLYRSITRTTDLTNYKLTPSSHQTLKTQ